MKNFVGIIIMLITVQFGFSQGAHSELIKMTTLEASTLAKEIFLDGKTTQKFIDIYVNHALAVEDLVVEVEPEDNFGRSLNKLEKEKDKKIKALLADEDYKLYEYKMEQLEIRASSTFDSLQHYLNNTEFNNAVIQYFDENVSPYLVYYHQTYFRPALKQKHYFKINRERHNLGIYEYKLDSMREAGQKVYAEDSPMADNVDKTLKELKRIRRKYEERLDYINVAMSPIVRQWNQDYIALVKKFYKDNEYATIEDYTKYLNAYGIDYVVGQLSLVLFNVYYPRGYVEGRDTLIELLRVE